MVKIGLTGGIGSGKTTVAKLFAEYGAPIIDADEIAHQLTLPQTKALQMLIEHFGSSVLNTDGTLNRPKLGALVFQNKSERQWLEKLLHPMILREMLRRIMPLKAPYCVLVIPLLAETKNVHFLDRTIVVDAPEALQIERVQARNGHLSLERINAILHTQSLREERLKIADDVIQNDGSLAVLAKAVKTLHEKYLVLAKHPQ